MENTIVEEDVKGSEKHYMSEIEFFVELLDEKTVDKVLKKFRESVEGFINPNFEKKKMYLKKILKGQTTKTRKAMSSKSPKMDPFLFCIMQYKIPDLQEVNENEIFNFISELDEIDDYVKFANVFIYSRDELKKRLPSLIDRYYEGLPIFEIEQVTRDDESAKAYFLNVYAYSGSKGMKKLYQRVLDYFNDEEKNQISDLKEHVKSLSLGELQSKVSKLKKEYPDFLVYFTYALTHLEEDQEVLLQIALNTLFKISNNLQKSNNISTASLELVKNQLSKKDEELLISLEKIKSMEVLEKKLNSLLDELKMEKDINLNLQNQIQKESEVSGKLLEYETKFIKELEEKQIIKASLDNANKEIKEYQKKELISKRELDKARRDFEKKYEKVEQEKQIVINDLKKIEQQFISLRENAENTWSASFAVIYTIDTRVLKLIYPEIDSVYLNEWNIHKNRIFNTGIRKIYVQREGLSTIKLKEIKVEANKYGIDVETIRVISERELLEEVVYIKIKERDLT